MTTAEHEQRSMEIEKMSWEIMLSLFQGGRNCFPEDAFKIAEDFMAVARARRGLPA